MLDEEHHRPRDVRPLARFHLVEQREAEKILRPVPEQRLGGRADVADHTGLVGDHREVGRPLHQRAETSLIRPWASWAALRSPTSPSRAS